MLRSDATVRYMSARCHGSTRVCTMMPVPQAAGKSARVNDLRRRLEPYKPAADHEAVVRQVQQQDLFE